GPSSRSSVEYQVCTRATRRPPEPAFTMPARRGAVDGCARLDRTHAPSWSSRCWSKTVAAERMRERRRRYEGGPYSLADYRNDYDPYAGCRRDRSQLSCLSRTPCSLRLTTIRM